jgi:hypothetical protein
LKAWHSDEIDESDEICCREAANLCKSGEPFLHRELHLLKNRNNTTVDFKNLKSVGVPYFRLNLSFKGIITKTFS